MVTPKNIKLILSSIHTDVIFCKPAVYVVEAFKLVLPKEMRDILAYPN